MDDPLDPNPLKALNGELLRREVLAEWHKRKQAGIEISRKTVTFWPPLVIGCAATIVASLGVPDQPIQLLIDIALGWNFANMYLITKTVWSGRRADHWLQRKLSELPMDEA